MEALWIKKERPKEIGPMPDRQTKLLNRVVIGNQEAQPDKTVQRKAGRQAARGQLATRDPRGRQVKAAVEDTREAVGKNPQSFGQLSSSVRKNKKGSRTGFSAGFTVIWYRASVSCQHLFYQHFQKYALSADPVHPMGLNSAKSAELSGSICPQEGEPMSQNALHLCPYWPAFLSASSVRLSPLKRLLPRIVLRSNRDCSVANCA